MNDDTYSIQILRAFQLYGPMFQAEATKLHGNFGLESHRLKAEYTKLFNKGYLMDDSGRLSITRPGERLLGNNEVRKRVNNAPLAAPRIMPDFRPLQAKNIPSVLGTRPGSNEYLQWPSHYGDCKK